MNIYLKLYNEALKNNHNYFYNEVNSFFSFKNIEIINFINDLALIGQVCIKKSKLMWLHGYLLYVSLDRYLKKNKELNEINILETGTARGFSSICMAKALYDNNRFGVIHTIDVINNNKKIKWNCIKDIEGLHTRSELWKDTKYSHLLKYIKFYNGRTNNILKNNFLKNIRINFAFLDAQHDFKSLNFELNFVKNKQIKNDIIICDDYTIYNNGKLQFPGINKAVDEFINYTKKIFFGNDGEKKRGYVYLLKN